MGRQVIADVATEAYLKSLCKIQEIVTGLIIGQPSKTSKDNVVHFAQSPATEKIQSISQVDANIFVNHVADVLKMLPGGMYILGIFVVAPKDVFSDTAGVQKLKSLVVNLQHTIKSNKLLLGDSDEFDDGEKLVLWYSSSNNSFNCKSFSGDSGKGAQLKGVDFKFNQKLSTQWVMVETHYELHEMLPIEDVEKASNEEILMLPLKYLTDTLDKSKVFLNGAPHEKSETLENLSSESKIVTAHIYKTCDADSDEPEQINNFNHTILAQGFLSSRTFFPVKATVAEAEAFIKQDILRTLAARVQILADSLVDTKMNPGEVVINEPPRRIYFPINVNARPDSISIQFSDYLFVHEQVATILQQIKDNLDLTLKVDQIQSNIEIVCDHQVANNERDKKSGNELKKSSEKGKLYLIGIIVALLVLILSIGVHFYLN